MSNDRPRALVSWSSGKDSAFALWTVLQEGSLEVAGLITTVTDACARVSMHGVREELLDLQAQAAGLPLVKVRIPAPCSNAEYESRMLEALAGARAEGG